jgi:cation transport ATPase
MATHSHDHAAVADAEVLDPVCRMRISPADSVGQLDYKGERYYFGNHSCLEQFKADPDRFLAADRTQASTPADRQPPHHLVTGDALNWIDFALTTPVVLWGAWPFFVRGWASVVNRHLNMFTLIALGVGAAYTFSVVATVLPGVFPASFRMNGSVAVYFEPAAVIVVWFCSGRFSSCGRAAARAARSGTSSDSLPKPHGGSRLTRPSAMFH